jgi:hypothetical protein
MILLGLESLYLGVIAQFAVDGMSSVPNLFGWRVPGQHMETTSRIAWVPGDPSGNMGYTLPARNPGGAPRTIAVLDELFTVYITGQDPSDPENELKQYHATRLLRDAWHRAVYLRAHGTFLIRTEGWAVEKLERRWGGTIRITATIQSPVWDSLGDSDVIDAVDDAIAAGTHVSSDIDVSLLDVTEGNITP